MLNKLFGWTNSRRARERLLALLRIIVWRAELPQSLVTNSRQPIQDFDVGERLFFRVSSANIDLRKPPEDRLLPAAISMPNQSVNRSRFSIACYAILPSPDHPNSPKWLEQGVYEASVDDIPPKLGHFEIRTEHGPEPNNYSHCELRSFDSAGNRVSPRNLGSKTERKEWRNKIFRSSSCSLVISPVAI